MKQRLMHFIEEQKLVPPGAGVLLAVSGGVDSAVMVELMSDYKIAIAHCNFQLRGEDSEQDQTLVESLAKRIRVPFFSARFETEKHANENKQSIQMAARELRYDWLEAIRKSRGYARIATAHQKNDSIETALINLIRGTGLKGIAGIPLQHEKIIRPMMCFWRNEIEDFAEKQKIEFRTDSSNFETKYLRNEIRHHLIPLLIKLNPAFETSFFENIEIYRELAVLTSEVIESKKKKLVEKRGNDLYVSIRKLQNLAYKKTILNELLREKQFNKQQITEAVSMLKSHSGKQLISASHRLTKDREFLIISKKEELDFSIRLIEKNDRAVDLSGAKLKCKTMPVEKHKLKVKPQFANLDFDKLQFPVKIRKLKRGDYFYPFGMKRKKKKVSNFLVDQKVPVNEKEKIMILESNKKIAWIVGHRIDERFKISANTKTVFQLEFKEK